MIEKNDWHDDRVSSIIRVRNINEVDIMPKNAFFNISEEKRKNFLDVAIKEFTSKSFEQVSVNNIIKSANIPRGSFYSYFENLDELFNYLIANLKKERMIYAKEIIKNSNKDFFVFIKELFAYDFEKFSIEGKYSLFRNYIHYIQYNKKGSIKDLIVSDAVADISKGSNINDIFNIKNYNLTYKEFLDVFEVVILIMVNTFLKAENEELDKNSTIDIFNKRMSYLEHGLRGDKLWLQFHLL